MLSNYNLDILSVTETWLGGEALAVPQGYDIFRQDRATRGGGVAVLVKKGLKVKILNVDDNNWKKPCSIELLCLSVQVSYNRCFILCTIYRTNYVSNDISNFNKLLHSFQCVQKPIIFLGDFNINMCSVDASAKFSVVLSRYKYSQLVKQPTRGDNLLDLVLCNRECLTRIYDIEVQDANVSDHLMVLFKFLVRRPKYIITRSISIPDSKLINWEQLITTVSETCGAAHSNNLDDAMSLIVERTLPLFHKHVPFKRINIRVDNNFMVSEKTNRLRKVKQWYQQRNSNQFRKKIKEYSKLITKSLENDHRLYLDKVCKSKGAWAVMGRLNIKFKRECKLEGDIDCDDINNYYIRMGFPPGVPFNDTLDNFDQNESQSNLFTVSEVSCSDIYKAWSAFKNKDSKTVDCVGYSKYILNVLLPIPHFNDAVLRLVNLSFTSGVIPVSLKTSRIVPVPKVDNAKSPDQFRPISLTPVLLLLMEKVFFNKLIKYVHDNDILSKCQFGFRRHHSTELAMIGMTDFIRKTINDNMICVAVSIDLRKAFDSVPRAKLLMKLRNLYNISTKWLYSFLSDRYQFVEVCGKKSNIEKTLIGVPAGSILAGILFSLFINDLPGCVPADCSVIFADDSNFLFVGTLDGLNALRANIETSMKSICIYLNDNGLTQNVDKTKMMTFSSPKIRGRLTNFAFSVDDCTIVNSDLLKCLGLYLDPLLKFDKHVEKMTTSCFLRIRSLYKIRHLMSVENLITIGQALVLSIVQYMSSVWGGTNASVLKNVEKVIRALGRLILNVRKYDKVADAISQDLKWLFPKKLSIFRTLTIFYKIYKIKCIPFFSGMFTQNSDVHTYSTRGNENIRCNVNVRNFLGENMFAVRATKYWNALPDTIRNASSPYSFRNGLKRYLISQESNVLL